MKGRLCGVSSERERMANTLCFPRVFSKVTNAVVRALSVCKHSGLNTSKILSMVATIKWTMSTPLLECMKCKETEALQDTMRHLPRSRRVHGRSLPRSASFLFKTNFPVHCGLYRYLVPFLFTLHLFPRRVRSSLTFHCTSNT